MFFRRKVPKPPTFEERLETLKSWGFEVQREGGRARISRSGCAAIIEEAPDKPKVERAGVLIGGSIGKLIDAGYQKFYATAEGKKIPATALHLKALHAFEQDLREALGLTSLYNESLGTVNDEHLYDRVEDRDRGTTRPWDVRPKAPV